MKALWLLVAIMLALTARDILSRREYEAIPPTPRGQVQLMYFPFDDYIPQGARVVSARASYVNSHSRWHTTGTTWNDSRNTTPSNYDSLLTDMDPDDLWAVIDTARPAGKGE